MRIRFSLLKLIAIIAVYAVYFAILHSFGSRGILIAIVTGTSVSGVIVLTRRENLAATCDVVFGGLAGAFVGWWCLGPIILGYDHGPREYELRSGFIGAAFGTIVGAILASIWTHSKSKNRNEEITSDSEHHSS